MAFSFDIQITQGSTEDLRLIASGSDNSVINLTNYGASGQVRRSYGSTGVIYDLSPSVNSNFYPSGFLDISVSSTADIPVGRFVYDVEVYSGSDVTKTHAGKFTVTPEVTR